MLDTLEYRGRIIPVSSTIKIGEGGHWKVYRVRLANPSNIDDNTASTVVIKIGGNEALISKNLNIYHAVTHSRLPTLLFYDECRWNGKLAIIAEDLNRSSTLYVSPNTQRRARIHPSDIVRIMRDGGIDRLKEVINDIECNRSEAEGKLSDNKIDLIKNIDEIINICSRDMAVATQAGLGMCEDAFFFGVSNRDNAVIDYKIADFDAIILNCETTLLIELKNTVTMFQSLWEFVSTFTSQSDVQQGYLRMIESRCQAIRQQISKITEDDID